MDSKVFFQASLTYQALRGEEMAMASNPGTSLMDLENNLKLQTELREALHILAKASAWAEERAASKDRSCSSVSL